jgi:hypothetical protein
MSSVPESPAGPDFSVRVVEDGGGGVVNDYDSFAEAYSAETEANLINGHYTRPAILDSAKPGASPTTSRPPTGPKSGPWAATPPR